MNAGIAAIPLRTLLLFGFVLSAQAQNPTISAIVNGASFSAGPVAPGMLANLFGTNLADSTLKQCANSDKTWPLSCNGVTVLVNGNAAPILMTLATQLLFQVPVDITGTSATVRVTRQTGGQTLQSTVATVPVAPTAPGLSTWNSSGRGPGAFADSKGKLVDVSNPTHPGDVLIAYGTGFGATNPVVNSGSPATQVSRVVASVKVTVSGQDAAVQFAGRAVGQIGMDQVNFVVPQVPARADAPVVVTVGGQNSQTVTLAVAPPEPTITGVSNNASGAPGIQSGSWVSIYGTNLSATTRPWQSSDFSGTALPTVIDGVSVKINGNSAAIYYVSPGQLNVQAPADTATGPVQVQVTNSNGSATGTATLQTYAPGFFTFQGKYVAAVHADRVYVAPADYFGGAAASRPARPGETLELYGTGFGPTTPAVPAGQIVGSAAPLTDPAQLHIRIGGVPATVEYAGIVAAGQYQFNVVIPVLPDGDQPIVADIGGVSTQSGLLITIKN